MASKKAGRAAGLAALAGLAYMASQDKGGSKSTGTDRDTDTGVDVMPSYAAKKANDITVSGEGGFDAPADMSKVSRVGTPASVARTTPTKTSSKLTSAASGIGIPGENAPSFRVGSTPDRAPGGVGKRGGVGDGGKSMVDRQNAAVARANRSMVLAGGKPMTTEEYYDSGKAKIDKEEGTFKRGGAVKRMASGGMTSSASSRGDGIASKGKTRCKMY